MWVTFIWVGRNHCVRTNECAHALTDPAEWWHVRSPLPQPACTTQTRQAYNSILRVCYHTFFLPHSNPVILRWHNECFRVLAWCQSVLGSNCNQCVRLTANQLSYSQWVVLIYLEELSVYWRCTVALWLKYVCEQSVASSYNYCSDLYN